MSPDTRTEQTYIRWIRRYILFHGRRHPREMGAPEVEAFRSDLAVRRSVAASTRNQALAPLLILYRDVLRIELPWLQDMERAKKTVAASGGDDAGGSTGGARAPRRPKPIDGGSLVRRRLQLMECVRLRVKSDVKTAMIYTHALNRGGRGVRSQLDTVIA